MKKFNSFPRAAFCLTALSFLFCHHAAAKGEWVQVRSANFYLVGDASEKDIRKVATKLEQFRETFRLLFGGTNVSSPIPTNVVVFKNAGSYKPFKPRRADGKADTVIAGYFQPGEDVNYITLSTEGEDADTFGTIFHEYVHFILDTNFGKSEVPTWFNEGLAEYYQTFQIERDQEVKLGLPQSGHLQLLNQTKLIPLNQLFGTSNRTLHQTGGHSRSIFYAQSWALVHYLIQSGKSAALGKFLKSLTGNVPAEKAFQESFQLTYADMEKELRKYVTKSSYQYQLITLKNKLTFDTEMQAGPLSEADSNAYLGDLLYHTNRADDAEPYLRTALSLNPDSSMANAAFGMVKIRQRKYDEAKMHLEKAVVQDQKNHLALYRLAYLMSREGQDEFGYVREFPKERADRMREILRKAIAVNPSFAESYELFAFVSLVNNDGMDEAVKMLQTALRYQPGNQRYALRIAEILARQQKFAEAKKTAEKIAATAAEDEIKSRADALVSQIRQYEETLARIEEQKKHYEERRKQYETASAERSGPPVMLKRPGQTEPTPEELKKAEEEANLRSINTALRQPAEGETQAIGRIQRVECRGSKITYHIKSETETFTLTSKDFEGLALTAFVGEDNMLNMGCGAKVDAVRGVLTYRPSADKKSGYRGELVAVDFVPDNFRLIDPSELKKQQQETAPAFVEMTAATEPKSNAESDSGRQDASSPPTADRWTVVNRAEDAEAARREFMMRQIKENLRQPQAGEKREIGFIEKTECGQKGAFFFLKTPTALLRLAALPSQQPAIRGFTRDIQNLQIGCGMKAVEIPVVFIYRPAANPKSKTAGEILSLEFVPKSFVLE